MWFLRKDKSEIKLRSRTYFTRFRSFHPVQSTTTHWCALILPSRSTEHKWNNATIANFNTWPYSSKPLKVALENLGPVIKLDLLATVNWLGFSNLFGTLWTDYLAPSSNNHRVRRIDHTAGIDLLACVPRHNHLTLSKCNISSVGSCLHPTIS